MLQKGLSNRPSGAVALLIIAGSLVLNLVRGENVLAELFWGNKQTGFAKLTCYAEQAACHLQKVFEEVIIGAPSDYGYGKKDRKVVEISFPQPPRPERHEPTPPKHLSTNATI